MRLDPKHQIAEDFAEKRLQYYRQNYEASSRANYLRRLRRALIERELEAYAPFGTILDIGSGPALLYPSLLAQSSKYYAVDLVESNLDEIRQSEPPRHVDLVCADLDTFEWKPDFFDAIVCAGALEYSVTPERNLAALSRALAPGGLLVCSFPNVFSPYRVWEETVVRPAGRLRRRVIRRHRAEYPRRLFSARAVARVLQSEAIAVRIVYFGLKLFPQPLDRLLAPVDAAILSRFERGRLQWLEPICSEFLVIARKRLGDEGARMSPLVETAADRQ